MMMKNAKAKLPKSLIDLARRAYPEYRGLKIRAEVRATYHVSNFWDGGSRNEVRAVDLETGRVQESRFSMYGEIPVPAGVALVEHAIFCGKDCGPTVIVAESAALEAVK